MSSFIAYSAKRYGFPSVLPESEGSLADEQSQYAIKANED
jgi:hypothetical protein